MDFLNLLNNKDLKFVGKKDDYILIPASLLTNLMKKEGLIKNRKERNVYLRSQNIDFIPDVRTRVNGHQIRCVGINKKHLLQKNKSSSSEKNQKNKDHKFEKEHSEFLEITIKYNKNKTLYLHINL